MLAFRRPLSWSLIALALAAGSLPAWAQTDDEKAFLTQGGAWHYKTVRCVDSTVTQVGYRLEDGATHVPVRDSGSVVAFATSLGYESLKGTAGGSIHAGVTKYETDPIMAAERPGDRVQVCLLRIPLPTKYCNPDKDARGWLFRVYDYRQHRAYYGMNSEHECGGA